MFEALTAYPEQTLLMGGLIIGFALGGVLQRSNFCAMGSLSDAVVFGDTRRLRAWILAAVTAIVGLHLLEGLGIVDVARTRYVGARMNWLGQLAGGYVFGIGMVLAGGCASRNIARAGSGDLRALIILVVIASFAFAAISGVLGHVRVDLAEATALNMHNLGFASQRLGDIIATASVAPSDTVRLTVTSLIVVAVSIFVFANRAFRSSYTHSLSGLAVGLAVTAAWALTGLMQDDFADRPTSIEGLSFVAPLGAALNWIERATAIGYPSFGAATVFGALLGSFVAAKASGTFHLQSFADVGDTVRHLTGAALMGVGGVFALGCTIGQGVSGISTLSVGSLFAVAAIVAGAVTTLKVWTR